MGTDINLIRQKLQEIEKLLGTSHLRKPVQDIVDALSAIDPNEYVTEKEVVAIAEAARLLCVWNIRGLQPDEPGRWRKTWNHVDAGVVVDRVHTNLECLRADRYWDLYGRVVAAVVGGNSSSSTDPDMVAAIAHAHARKAFGEVPSDDM